MHAYILILLTYFLFHVGCHFYIYLTEAGVMLKAGYVYSIWST